MKKPDDFSGNSGLLLISAGIDSPVAGYLMLRKGMKISAINFRMPKERDNCHDKYVVELLKVLAENTAAKIKLYTSGIYKLQRSFQDNCDKRYQCIFCKRIMHRLAEKTAYENGIDFLITGENMGQVASQTISNMRVIDSVLKIPVIRPLVSMDKNETINIAKKIGTFDISKRQKGCCSFVPRNPKTQSNQRQVEAQESRLDINSLLDDAFNDMITKEIG